MATLGADNKHFLFNLYMEALIYNIMVVIIFHNSTPLSGVRLIYVSLLLQGLRCRNY